MNIVRSWFIQGRFRNIFDNYYERNNVLKLNNVISKLLQSVYTDHSSDSLKRKRCRVTLAAEVEMVFWAAQVVPLFYSNIRKNSELFCCLRFVRFFEIIDSIDIDDRVQPSVFSMGYRKPVWQQCYHEPTSWWQFWRRRFVPCNIFYFNMISISHRDIKLFRIPVYFSASVKTASVLGQ